MKKEILFATTVTLFAAGNALLADDLSTTNNTSLRYDNPPPVFRANEFSVEAFGTDAIDQHTINHLSGHNLKRDSTLGVGIGANYFFLPFLGIGGQAYTENTDAHFVDDVDGSLIVRIPIPLGNTGLGLAPYGFGGGGHKFDPVEASYVHAGGGVEFRFTPHIGIFVDARYVWADHIKDYGLGRAGVRFAF